MSLPDNNWLFDVIGNEIDDVNFPETQDQSNSITVTQWLRAIYAIKKKIGRLKDQRDEATYYYATKMKTAQAAIDYIEEQITGYLKFHKLRNIATPQGTAYITAHLKREFGENEEELLNWAKENAPETVNTVMVINKSELLKYIKATGNIPPHYTEESHESLGIRS